LFPFFSFWSEFCWKVREGSGNKQKRKVLIGGKKKTIKQKKKGTSFSSTKSQSNSLIAIMISVFDSCLVIFCLFFFFPSTSS